MNKCKICGNETKNDNYCSMKCRDVSRKNKSWITIKCKTCGVDVLCRKSRIKIYCSNNCSSKDPEINRKRVDVMRKTKLEKYGDENYTNLEKRKKTHKDRYGVEHPLQRLDSKEKMKKTTLERYGVEYAQQSGTIKEKTKKTVIERYGGFPFESEIFKNEIKKTMLEKYGVDNALKSDVIHNKVKETNIEKYGIDTPLRDIEKMKNALLNKYGVSNISKLEENKLKIRKIHIKNFIDKIFEGDRLKGIVTPMFTKEDYIDVSRENKYKFECNKCKTVFEDFLADGHIPKCPTCYPHVPSQPELEVLNYIKSLIPDEEILHNTRKTVDNEFELDIYIPSRKLVIEYNGLYWHSEISSGKDKQYHLKKTIKCKEKGIRLIHIFENDWMDRQEIVKSILCNLLNINTTPIYARKCEIVELNNKDKDIFISANHIQKSDKSSIRIGLKYNDELVSVMTFTKSRFDKTVEYEMSRYCNKLFTNVVGGAGRLFNYFINTYNPKSVVSYCDRKLFNGMVYEKIGFKFKDNTPPNYYYTDYTVTLNRIGFQKHKLSKILPIFDPSISEWSNMKNNGYDRIWDCGNLKFVWDSSFKNNTISL